MTEVAIDPAVVLGWVPAVQAFYDECRRLRKARPVLANIDPRERIIGQAMECAVVVRLGKTPNLVVAKGFNDSGIDCYLDDGRSVDFKTSVIRSYWGGISGFNTYGEGRVKADLLIACKVRKDFTRAAVVGYALRDDPMMVLPKLRHPAYPVESLNDPSDLFRPIHAPPIVNIEVGTQKAQPNQLALPGLDIYRRRD